MYQYSNSLIRQFPSLVTGNAAVGVQATVYVGETNTLAQLFEVSGAAKSNPVTTDSKGFYSFSLADGDYRIVFSSSQFATLRISVLDGAQIREDFEDLAASNEQFKDDQQNNYSAFTASQQAAYDAFVLSQGWDQIGTFAVGFTFTSPNQVGQDNDGNWWRSIVIPKTVAPATDPTSDSDYKLVGDGVLRSDLASTMGASLVGFQRTSIANCVLSTIQVHLNSLEYSIFEFSDYAVKPDPEDSATWVWTTAFAVAQAVILALGGGSLRCPTNRYMLDGAGIQTTPSDSYYRQSDPAFRIIGDGWGTVLTRGENTSGDVIDYADPATYHDSVFNIHSSNIIIENLRIVDAKSAFYFGQKDGEVDTCHASFNRIKNIWVADCGVALHMRSGAGCYYNTFEDWHVWQCQVGEYIDKHPTSAESNPNCNRNNFRMLRNARCHVGLWLKMGDTNQFFGQHNEGCTLTPTSNRYTAPAGLPYGLVGGVGQLIETNGTNNEFVACNQESCTVELVNGGVRNSFMGLYRDEEAGKVRHIVKPIFYVTRTMNVNYGGNSYWFSNTQSDIFAGKQAGVIHNELRGLYPSLVVSEFIFIGSDTDNNTKRLFDVGAMASGAAANITIWPALSLENSAAAFFDVTVLGNALAANLAHATKFKILALRNGSGTLVRYYVYDTTQARATGTNAGDLTEPFTPTLSLSGNNLVLTITAPARVFGAVLVNVERTLTK